MPEEKPFRPMPGNTMSNRVSFQPLPRGVYLAPYTVNGDRFFYAVDETGEMVGCRPVPIGADADAACEELWAKLDARPSQSDVSGVPSSHLRLIAG